MGVRPVLWPNLVWVTSITVTSKSSRVLRNTNVSEVAACWTKSDDVGCAITRQAVRWLHLPSIHAFDIDHPLWGPSPQRAGFFMPSLTPVERIRRLDKSSPQFPRKLVRLLHGHKYEDYVKALPAGESSWLVEYLDNVRPELPLSTCLSSSPRFLTPSNLAAPRFWRAFTNSG